MADGWTVQQDPNDSQAVDVIPSVAAAKVGAQAYKWKAPVMVSRPPVEECGVATAQGSQLRFVLKKAFVGVRISGSILIVQILILI